MKTIIAIVLIIAIVSCGNLRNRVHYEYAFEEFTRLHNKIYSTSEEYIYRLQIFANNLDIIEIHNAAPSSYKLGVNKFTDLSNEEFVASKFCGGLLMTKRIGNVKREAFKGIQIPDEIDWTTKSAVTQVKDQGACGSCWAFSATGSLESVYYLKNKVLKEFSEQQLVDCSGDFGNMGCNGGLMTSAFDYVKDSGLCLESDYPYHAKDEKCKTTCKSAVHISNYLELEGTEKALAEGVAERPVSIAINASPLQSYKSGIFDGVCSDSLNHGVLAVGYGTLDGKKYWKVKNSWGKSWGENGYFRIIKDVTQKGGRCGLAEMTTYPVVV